MKLFKILGIILLILGLAIIGVGICINVSEDIFIKDAIKTEATIERIKTINKDGKQNTYPIVKYIVEKENKDGEIEREEYYKRLSYYNINMKVGDKITVYYKEDNPKEIKVEEHGNTIFSVFGKLGGVISISGALVMTFSKEKRKRRKSYY